MLLGSDAFKAGVAINVSANNIALNGAPGFDVCLPVVRGLMGLLHLLKFVPN